MFDQNIHICLFPMWEKLIWTCNIIQEGRSFKFDKPKCFTVKQIETYKSKNVAQSLICKHYGEFYIRQIA